MSIIQFASAFLISLVVTALLSPLARRVAWKWGLVDEPNARRINKVPMPTGGGLAIFGGFLAASLVGDLPHLSVTVLAAVLILVIGILDDRYQLSAGAKFAGQLAAVLIYVLWGPRIEFISNPFGGMITLGSFPFPDHAVGAYLINIMNFIDGLDGLTTGIALIAAAALASLALLLGRYDAALMAIIVVGAALGFLPYNFNPAKLYLGDGGAMLLGFLLAAISTVGALKGAATISISVPILILAVPVTDLLCAVVRRMQNGVPFYQADRSHFHHRLLDLGFSQRQVAGLAYLITLFSATMAVLTAHLSRTTWLVALVLGLVFWYGSIRVGMIQPFGSHKGESKDA